MEQFFKKKSLGQHFLTSDHIPKKMCEAASVGVGDVVVEIGPGTGVLTRELLGRGATVHAVETDLRAIRYLETEFADALRAGTLTLTNADMRSFTISTLPVANHGYAVVANIPYYLTGQLFRVFLEAKVQPHTIVFLTQKEVARRATETGSEQGRSSLLSLSLQYFGTTDYVATVKRGNFSPPPQVDSAIVRVSNTYHERDEVPPEVFFRALKAGFGQKRKQLKGNLRSLYENNALSEAFSANYIRETARAEDLCIEEWICLIKTLENYQKYVPNKTHIV